MELAASVCARPNVREHIEEAVLEWMWSWASSVCNNLGDGREDVLNPRRTAGLRSLSQSQKCSWTSLLARKVLVACLQEPRTSLASTLYRECMWFGIAACHSSTTRRDCWYLHHCQFRGHAAGRFLTNGKNPSVQLTNKFSTVCIAHANPDLKRLTARKWLLIGNIFSQCEDAKLMSIVSIKIHTSYRLLWELHFAVLAH